MKPTMFKKINNINIINFLIFTFKEINKKKWIYLNIYIYQIKKIFNEKHGHI